MPMSADEAKREVEHPGNSPPFIATNGNACISRH
jgi:hypothetical protein